MNLRTALLFAFMLFIIIWIVGCRHTPYGENSETGKYYPIRGIKMYCETYGEGKPLLLIHGNGGSINTFGGVIPFFSAKYKVIVADSRAQGKSRDDRDSLTFEQMADDYAALLDKLHIDSANVFGWSDGGIIALLLAVRHPAKVAKLAASGANLWPDSTAIEPPVWKSSQIEYAYLRNKPRKSLQEKMHWKCLLLDCTEPHISLTDLSKINCPALIMGGDHDLIRQEHLKLIYNAIPKANYWIIPNCGHATLFEHKYQFMYGVGRFFSQPFNKTRTY